ncbi:IS110 family RNA-guided transposase [Paraglaciecola polaris]|uniref:Transposase for insertion sequence element IS1328 n=1 Tax=Paraglaciecola polaris LMG 21857 TaxID=1129793 RepID=K7AGA6_9ALTE|nr:IS110 family transposase [Paraglaciecola polaris]GAC34285.1 transposase for insertion sequence element IS1328 [Paraglaciecola polaris LMG 21857]
MNNLNTIAIDLAKNVFQLCILSPERKVTVNKQVSRQKLIELMANQKGAVVAMEACYSSHYWARLFDSMGHEVRLIPAQHVKPFVRGNKNDHNDAIAIAEASWRPNIQFVPLKTVEQQDIQALHRIRDKLISRRTSIINQTRGLLSEYGVIIPVGLIHFAHSLPTLIDPADIRISLRMKHQLIDVKNEYDTLSERCLSIDKQLKAYVNQNALCQRLMTLPGIGFINATALYASIGNACQFAKPRELSVWLGVTPRQYASGEKSYNTGITKRGNPYLRKQLIHGARSLIHRAKKKHDKLSIWINQIVERRGKNKAAVAIANRLARLAWILLHRNEDYRAFAA